MSQKHPITRVFRRTFDTGDTGDVYLLFMDTDGTVKRTSEINSNTVGGLDLTTTAHFGASVASIGDINGDGITDMAVGSTGTVLNNDLSGLVHVLFMAADGTVADAVAIDDQTAGNFGIAFDEAFGASIAGIGDRDGDGTPDIAVGAPGDLTRTGATGSLYILFMNADGSVKNSQVIDSGTQNGPDLELRAFFGFSVASIGDRNDDGTPDIAVGAPGDLLRTDVTGSLYILLIDDPAPAQSSVSGTVFSDTDGNGVLDAGEPGIEGYRMLAIDYSTSQVMEAYTADDGTYTFNVTPAPATTLVQTWYYPPGTTVADPATSWFRYVMPEAGSTTTFDVGFYPVPPREQVRLDILAYGDDNANGRMDQSERGIGDLDSFYVYTYTTGPVAYPVTDAAGMATVGDLVPADFALLVFADRLAESGYVWASTVYERDDADMYDRSLPVAVGPEPGSTHTVTVGLVRVP